MNKKLSLRGGECIHRQAHNTKTTIKLSKEWLVCNLVILEGLHKKINNTSKEKLKDRNLNPANMINSYNSTQLDFQEFHQGEEVSKEHLHLDIHNRDLNQKVTAEGMLMRV
jgi:hypothetical protein